MNVSFALYYESISISKFKAKERRVFQQVARPREIVGSDAKGKHQQIPAVGKYHDYFTKCRSLI